jgi:hypothetical protein
MGQSALMSGGKGFESSTTDDAGSIPGSNRLFIFWNPLLHYLCSTDFSKSKSIICQNHQKK